MSISPDDLAQLRSKLSDDQIVQGLSNTDPTDASDIKTLQGKGLNSGQILEGFAQYNAPAEPSPSTGSSLVNGAKNMGQSLAYGVAQEAHMLGATSKALGGSGNWSQAVEDGANKAGGLLGDMSQYKPASSQLGLSPSTWGNIPRAMVEGLPMVGGMAAAAAAAPEALLGSGAGLLGAAAYGTARHLGETAQARAANDGRQNVTGSDVMGAIPGSVAQGAVDAVGNRMLMTNGVMAPNPVTGAGAKAMAQTLMNLGKTTATNAATGAASDAIGQAGSEIGTNAGYNPNINQSLHAGVVGGLTAAGMKGLESVPQTIMNARLSSTDPTVRGQVADDLNSTRFTGDPDNPADHQKLMSNAIAGYKQEVAGAMQDTSATAKEISSQGGATSHIDDALDYAKQLMTNLQQGKLDPEQVQEAQTKLSGQPALLSGIMKLNEIHNISDMANVNGGSGGATPSAWDIIHAYKAYKGLTYLGGASLMGGHPLAAAGLLAAPLALTAAARAKAGIMGDSRLISDYAQRFGSQSQPGSPMGAQPPIQPQQPQPQQAPPQAGPHPLEGEILPPQLPTPRSQLALPRPPIYGQAPEAQYGPHDGVPQGEPYSPQQPPEAPPQAPRQLAPPLRQLPAPDHIYGPEQTTERGMALGTGEQAPGFLMLRNALQKAQSQQQAPEAPQPAAQQEEAPTGNPKVIAKVAKVVAKANETPPVQTFNEQANAIEKQITDAQSIIKDPTSSPEAVSMAKAAVRKAALGAAAQHDASHGGGKGPKKAVAPHAAAAHSGHSGGGQAHANGGEHVTPGMTHIHTSVGEKVQATANIRKNPEAVGQGVVKSRGTRFEIADKAKSLPLSPAGKTHVGEAMEGLKSTAEAKATNNRSYGAAALKQSLSGFNEADRAILQNHFNTATSSHGTRFLDSWTHATPEAKATADVKNAGFAKAKITRKANTAKKNQ